MSKMLDYERVAGAQLAAKSTGGMNLSSCIELDGQKWQLKSSFLDKAKAKFKSKAQFKDWGKSGVKGGTDHENLGELIASCLGSAISSKEGSNIVTPEVEFVQINPQAKKGKNQGIKIASKYLDGFTPFESRAKEALVAGGKKIRSVTVNFSDTPKKPPFKLRKDGQIRGFVEVNEQEKKGICEGLALNMLFGNADVNAKGNMGTAKDGKIGCIDFGHGFNNLITGPELLGGGVHNKNGILDFINRDKVVGSPSKLWRDYDSMIPTKEFAEALHQVAKSETEIAAGMKTARTKLQEYAKGLGNDKGKQAMFIDSLQRLNRNVGKGNARGETVDSIIFQTVQNLEGFAVERSKQMEQVAKMVDLQVKIDEAIKRDPKTVAKDLEIERAYQQIISGVDKKEKMTWVKTGAKEKPFVGDLEGYIKARQKQLEKSQTISRSSSVESLPSKKSLSSKSSSSSLGSVVSEDSAKSSPKPPGFWANLVRSVSSSSKGKAELPTVK